MYDTALLIANNQRFHMPRWWNILVAEDCLAHLRTFDNIIVNDQWAKCDRIYQVFASYAMSGFDQSTRRFSVCRHRICLLVPKSE